MERLNGKSELSRFYLKRELILVVYKFVNSFLLTLTFGQSFRSMSAVLCIVYAGLVLLLLMLLCTTKSTKLTEFSGYSPTCV